MGENWSVYPKNPKKLPQMRFHFNFGQLFRKFAMLLYLWPIWFNALETTCNTIQGKDTTLSGEISLSHFCREHTSLGHSSLFYVPVSCKDTFVQNGPKKSTCFQKQSINPTKLYWVVVIILRVTSRYCHRVAQVGILDLWVKKEKCTRKEERFIGNGMEN